MLVYLGGVNRTNNVDQGSLEIEDALTHDINECRFEMRDATTSPWTDIVVYRRDGVTKEFAGYVMDVKQSYGTKTRYNVTCQDYGCLLTTARVNESLEGYTDQGMIQALFSEYLSEIDTSTYVGSWGQVAQNGL